MLLALFIVLPEYLNIPAHQINFCFGLSFLVVELFAVYQFNRAMKSTRFTFQLSSNAWLVALLVTSYLVYSFSSAGMNTWNVLAMVLVLNAGAFYATLNKRTFYIVTDSEIVELNRDKRINISDVTEIEAAEQRVSVHTNKYRNHITVTPKQLAFPTFPALRAELEKLIITPAGRS